MEFRIWETSILEMQKSLCMVKLMLFVLIRSSFDKSDSRSLFYLWLFQYRQQRQIFKSCIYNDFCHISRKNKVLYFLKELLDC